MNKENNEIQPATDFKTKVGNFVKRSVKLLKLKNLMKKKNANERYAFILLGAAFFINIIAILFQAPGDFLVPSTSARLAFFFWVFSAVLTGLSAWFFTAASRKPKLKPEPQPELQSEVKPEVQDQSFLLRARNFIWGFISHRNFLALFPILLLAFILRAIPMMNQGLFPDEWYWLNNAKLALKGDVVSPFGFIGDQPSNFAAYPLALLLFIVRNPLLAVRLIGIIYSLTAIVLVYFLAKRIFRFKAAVCAALLMSVSIWDIHMSTLGWLNVSSNPMLVAAMLILLYKIWERKYTTWTLFGLAFLMAVNLHLLYITALLVIPAGLTLLIHWIKNRIWKAPREIILFGLFFFICVSPLFLKMIKHPESFMRHSEFIEYNLNMSGESKNALGYYWDQTVLLGKDYFRHEVEYADQSVWGLTLDWPIQVLSVLGIFLIIIQTIRKKRDYFWLVVMLTFFLQLFVPLVLFYRTTSIWRAYPVLPIIYLFSVYTLVEISRLMKLITQKWIIKKKGLLTIFLIANMTLYFMLNALWFTNFFSNYAKIQDRYESVICKTAAKLIDENVPQNSTIYLPDEMCFTLVSVLFDENKYHFISVQLDNPPNLSSGDYVVILNSQNFPGIFNGDIQNMLRQKLDEKQTEMISPASDSSPVIYWIK